MTLPCVGSVRLAVRPEQVHLGIVGQGESGQVQADRLRPRGAHLHDPYKAPTRALLDDAPGEISRVRLADDLRDRLHDAYLQRSRAVVDVWGCEKLAILLRYPDFQPFVCRAFRDHCGDLPVGLLLVGDQLGHR